MTVRPELVEGLFTYSLVKALAVTQKNRFQNQILWLDIQSLAYYDAFSAFRVCHDRLIH